MNNNEILLRKCISCYERKNKSQLIRICKTKDNNIEIDLTYKKEGRGAYICNDSEKCLKDSIKYNKISRSLKMEIPSNVILELQKQIWKN